MTINKFDHLSVNAYLIKQHFYVELALFRELIEEAFDGQDFQENEHGDGKKIINTHDDVVKLRQWLKRWGSIFGIYRKCSGSCFIKTGAFILVSYRQSGICEKEIQN